MKTVLYRGNNTSSVGNTNPLPVQNYRDADSYEIIYSSDNAVNGNIIKTATSGKSIYITDLVISAKQTTEIWFYDGAGTDVTKKIYLAANGNFSHSWNTPKKVAASQNLLVKTTGQTQFTVDITGYVI